MHRALAAWRIAAYIGLGSCLLALFGCSQNDPRQRPLADFGPIQHVVIIFQENRSTDNLFQDPVLIARGADIVSQGVDSHGNIIPLSIRNLGNYGPNPSNYDTRHSHADFLAMCDADQTGKCRMDGADKIVVQCLPTATNCPPPNPQFAYVDPNDIQPYFQLAEQYAFADRMFQTNQGPSFPAHQFILSGTSAPAADSDLFAANNPKFTNVPTGCIAPPHMYVDLIDPSGALLPRYPCYEHPTLTDLLDDAGLSWRYYAGSYIPMWTAPTAIKHMCQPNLPPPNGTACVGPDYTGSNPKVFISDSHNPQIVNDIANHALPVVSWVIPGGQMSDHPATNDGCGPAWVTTIVNAIGNSEYWSHTAIILAWDDWGGLYDHVAPPIINSYEYGFRVPMIVISPYAKFRYISHSQHDFGSILHFIEERFKLQSLGYADAKADDLGDMFDFTQAPIPFTEVVAPGNYHACQAKTEPLTDPDDD